MRTAAAVAIFAASLLFMLLARMRRDAGGRVDTSYFLAGGAASGVRLVVLAAALLGGWDVGQHPFWSRAVFLASLASIFPLLLFSYSFPLNRRAPGWLLGGAGLLTLAVAVLAAPAVATRPLGRAIVGTYFIAVVALAVYFQHRNRRELVRESGVPAATPTRLVQASIAVPWILSTVVMIAATHVRHGPPSQTALVAQALLGTVAVIVGVGVAILRYHLFDIRVMAYELVIAVLACAGYAGWLVWGAPALLDVVAVAGGAPLAAAALTVVPPLVIRSAWALLHARMNEVACAIAKKSRPRSTVEHVLEETGRMVDPRAVLGAVSAAIEDVTGGDVRFLRAAELPAGEYESAPAPLVRAASSDTGRSFFARSQSAELEPELATAIDAADACMLLPVRRGATVYGFIAVRGCRASRDAATVCSTLADHLAIKLENFALYGALEESRRLASLGSFAAAIAHDIRTPLTSIQMNVQILRSRACLSDSDKEYLEIAVEEIDRLNRSVGEILDYAKPLALNVAQHDVDDVLDDAVRTVEPLFDERGIRVERGPRRPSLRVAIDERRIRQVLVNLLDNAADASPRGGAVEITARALDGGRVLVEVRDRGKGIEPANVEKIFEPFFTTRADGTGLGLAIAQKIVRAHGGDIGVASEPGRGTTFAVALAESTEAASDDVAPRAVPKPAASDLAPAGSASG